MSSALKIARLYKDINNFIHINRTTFWADTYYFSGSESQMQLENAYAIKEWQIESVIKNTTTTKNNNRKNILSVLQFFCW